MVSVASGGLKLERFSRLEFYLGRLDTEEESPPVVFQEARLAWAPGVAAFAFSAAFASWYMRAFAILAPPHG